MPPRTTRNSLALDPSDLTDNEGMLLALLLRRQPITAYQLAKHFEVSPLGIVNSSKGAVYPAITRLRVRGLIAAEAIEGDRRGAEQLVCTDTGRAAVKQWTMDLREPHFVPVDPLRSKVMSFDLLSRDERIEWIVDAKAHMTARLEAIEADGDAADSTFDRLGRDGAVATLKARLQWLDRLLHAVVKAPRDSA